MLELWDHGVISDKDMALTSGRTDEAAKRPRWATCCHAQARHDASIIAPGFKKLEAPHRSHACIPWLILKASRYHH